MCTHKKYSSVGVGCFTLQLMLDAFVFKDEQLAFSYLAKQSAVHKVTSYQMALAA